MPSKTAKQAKLMRIAAHTPGGYGGVPQGVGADFEAADKAKGKFYTGAGKVRAGAKGRTGKTRSWSGK